MIKDERFVVGYHGTNSDRAEAVVSTGVFAPSENDYDWLGHGIYFWEHAPSRAWQWARAKHGAQAAVIEARIQLGYCLDLSDINFTEALRAAYEGLSDAYARTNSLLPINRGKARCLDCMVINYLTKFLLPQCETVRAPFLEGEPIYTGSELFTQSHMQLVVRKGSNIEEVRRVWPKED